MLSNLRIAELTQFFLVLRMSEVITDNESMVSEVPETPKKTGKGCSKNAPKGTSVEAGKRQIDKSPPDLHG